jgi:hypothetical protein
MTRSISCAPRSRPTRRIPPPRRHATIACHQPRPSGQGEAGSHRASRPCPSFTKPGEPDTNGRNPGRSVR